VFSRLHSVRLAARSIARDESFGTGRYLALVELVDAVRKEFADDPWLAAQAQRVVYGESYELLIHGRTPAAPEQTWGADPVTTRLWAMSHQGLQRCPECRREVPGPEVLARWEDSDRAGWAEARAREVAPKKEVQAGDAA
jgi:hypothetical protein